MQVLGLAGTVAQLSGFTLGIYVISDWNEMEPWTWIFQAWYMMLGSWYFMFFRSDWDYTSVYSSFLARNQRLIAEKENFSFEKVEALENYVSQIETYYDFMYAAGQMITDDSDSKKQLEHI